MHREKNVSSSVLIVVAGLFVFLLAGWAFLLATGTASGSASLPNGATAYVDGPFSCAENKGLTTINAGGRVFAFTKTAVTVDGVPVATLDPTVTQIKLKASSWTASLQLEGREVALPR